jgi:hypothetical protein
MSGCELVGLDRVLLFFFKLSVRHIVSVALIIYQVVTAAEAADRVRLR